MEKRISYRWSCPYCETSRSSWGAVEAEELRRRAKQALYSHVSSVDSDEHGPRYSVPEGFDPDCHLERIDE